MVSSDGILFFGYHFQNDDLPWGKRDIEEWLGELYEGENPPVSIAYHCHEKAPQYYVSVQTFWVSRGYPKALKDTDLAISPEWKEIFLDFQDRLGLSLQERKSPSWHLASLLSE